MRRKLKLHLRWGGDFEKFFGVTRCGTKMRSSRAAIPASNALYLNQFTAVPVVDRCAHCHAILLRDVSKLQALQSLPNVTPFNSLSAHRQAIIQAAKHEAGGQDA